VDAAAATNKQINKQTNKQNFTSKNQNERKQKT
jgi:hypothetical protein